MESEVLRLFSTFYCLQSDRQINFSSKAQLRIFWVGKEKISNRRVIYQLVSIANKSIYYQNVGRTVRFQAARGAFGQDGYGCPRLLGLAVNLVPSAN